MSRTIRSRRAEEASRPLYARALRLHHLAPSGLLCFVFLEGAVVLGILLALAELVSWWGVLVLPITVALMVKFNDLVAGVLTPRPVATETTSVRAPVLRPAAMPERGRVSSETTPYGEPGAGRYAPEHLSAGYGPGTVSDGYGPAVMSESFGDGYPPEGTTGVPAVGYPGTYTSGSGYGTSYGFPAGGHNAGPVHGGDNPAVHVRPAVTPAPGYGSAAQEHSGESRSGAPIRRPWAEQLDVRQQIARQAAARRYE